jgi:hypothetical protein
VRRLVAALEFAGFEQTSSHSFFACRMEKESGDESPHSKFTHDPRPSTIAANYLHRYNPPLAVIAVEIVQGEESWQ